MATQPPSPPLEKPIEDMGRARVAKRTTGKGPGGGQRQLRTALKTARRHSASSQRWLERQLNDPYVSAAKREGLRSRAAYKLKEIDARHHILRSGHRVVDLGAAPGGWSQIAAEKVKSADGKGQVVAIDYLAMDPIPGVVFLQKDFTDDGAEDDIKSCLRDGGADVVLSDMAAPTTGHTNTDHLRITALAETAAAFAIEILTPGGTFLCKLFQGGAEKDLLDLLRKRFAKVRHVKPPASRSDSAELYILATGFR